MMIKRFGNIDITEYYITISRDTDEHRDNLHSIPIYFDAAFSRKIIAEKNIIGAYTMIKELIPLEQKPIILIYDPKTFSQEQGYEYIKQYLETNNNISVIKGKCECLYDLKHESINVIIKEKENVK